MAKNWATQETGRNFRLSNFNTLTQFMFGRVIRDHHDIQFEAHVTLPNGVDVGDVWTFLGYRLHELWGLRRKVGLKVFKELTLNTAKNLQAVKRLSYSSCMGGPL